MLKKIYKNDVVKLKFLFLTIYKRYKNLNKKVFLSGLIIFEKTLTRKNIIFLGVKVFSKTIKIEKNNMFDFNDIKLIIDNESIKVVSFDIFDTLMFRPVIVPTDVFYLINKIVTDKFSIDFIKIRMNVEPSDPKTNINDIYNEIRYKFKIPLNILEQIKRIELSIEKKLLTRRKEVFELYKYALKKNKRIIATSDMYLSSSFLKECLEKEGYMNISELYVSNEYSKRKDSGDLFDVVIDKEKILPTQLLHIGDNLHSDYLIPMSKGIIAYQTPSIVDVLFHKNTIWKKLGEFEDPLMRILLGFVINNSYEKLLNNKTAMFDSHESLGEVGLGLILLTIVLQIANNKDISNNYNEIYFASRDGFLPEQAYRILKKENSEYLDSYYFESGRLLYYSIYKNSFKKFIEPDTSVENIKLETFLNELIHDKEIKLSILSKLTKKEKNTGIRDENLSDILSRYEHDFEKYISSNNEKLTSYYESIFKSKRNIVFDCGYSGSISIALHKATSNSFDKIYLFQTDENKIRDEKNNTKTISLFGYLLYFVNKIPTHIILEELFSPLNKRPIYIDDNLEPVYKNEFHSAEMINDLSKIQKSSLKTVSDFVNTFNDLIKYFDFTFPESCLLPLIFSITESRHSEENLFKNILFEDFARINNKNLTQKTKNDH